MFTQFANAYFRGLAECYEEVSLEKLERVAEILLQAYRQGRKLLILGNGGSAATASHMACDFSKGTATSCKPGLRVISLTDNVALISAWANDVGYEAVFQRQLDAALDVEDVVLGVSASGNSPNVLRAMQHAKQHGAITVGFIGFGGGKLKGLVDVDITVSSRNYGHIEDLHLTLNHALSQYLKQRIAEEEIVDLRSTVTAHDGMLRLFFSKPLHRRFSPAIFVDRDGIINERIVEGYVTHWEKFRFLEGIERVLTQLSELKLPIIVLSNQAAIGKGLMNKSSLFEITRRFVSVLNGAGARIDAVYYCPHRADENCHCRKPQPGMFEQAVEDWQVDLHRSVLIGDSVSDMEAALAAHCRPIILAQDGRFDGIVGQEIQSLPGGATIKNVSEIIATVHQLLEHVGMTQSQTAAS